MKENAAGFAGACCFRSALEDRVLRKPQIDGKILLTGRSASLPEI